MQEKKTILDMEVECTATTETESENTEMVGDVRVKG